MVGYVAEQRVGKGVPHLRNEHDKPDHGGSYHDQVGVEKQQVDADHRRHAVQPDHGDPIADERLPGQRFRLNRSGE
jgi:hypothetical protein